MKRITMVISLVEKSHSKPQMWTSVEDKSQDLQSYKISFFETMNGLHNIWWRSMKYWSMKYWEYWDISRYRKILWPAGDTGVKKAEGHQSRVPPVDTMDICTKFHGSPSNSCCFHLDQSAGSRPNDRQTSCSLHVARWQKNLFPSSVIEKQNSNSHKIKDSSLSKRLLYRKVQYFVTYHWIALIDVL